MYTIQSLRACVLSEGYIHLEEKESASGFTSGAMKLLLNATNTTLIVHLLGFHKIFFRAHEL